MAKSPLKYNGLPLKYAAKPLASDLTDTNPCCIGNNAVIPCCIREVKWEPTLKLLDPPANFINALDFDCEFTLTTQEGNELTSVNVAVYDEAGSGGTTLEYQGGWTNFDWGQDISDDLFQEPEPGDYPVIARIIAKNHGRGTGTPADARVELTVPSFQAKGSDGIWYDLEFDSMVSVTPGGWTIAANTATSKLLSLGDEVELRINFNHCPDRQYIDTGDCLGFAKWRDSSKCYKRSGASDEAATLSTTPIEIEDCLDDSVCECGCQEVAQTCLCEDALTPTTSDPGDRFNTEEHGETKRRVTPPTITDTNHTILSFDFLPADLGASPIFSNSSGEMYWAGYQALASTQNAVLEVYYSAFSDDIFARLTFVDTGAGIGVISVSGDRNGYFAASDTHWNRISVDWIVDGSNRRLKLTVEPLDGVTGPTSKESANVTTFSSHRVPGIALLGGAYGVGSIPERTKGCFQNYPEAA